ncbi:MAG: hypothetical protein RBS34_00430 [Desulfofustis sp.]|jgi:hypothetical protein|nr:hypothetical protein [Desulfofustis sp.]
MNLCPKSFGYDMTDPANLAYCRSIQNFERCSKCEFYIVDVAEKENVVKREAPKAEQGMLW